MWRVYTITLFFHTNLILLYIKLDTYLMLRLIIIVVEPFTASHASSTAWYRCLNPLSRTSHRTYA